MAEEDLVAQLARRYSQDAEAYRELWAPELLPLGMQLLDRMDVREVGRLLDLGAGVGALAGHERSAAPDARLVLADRAEGMLRLAPRETGRVVVDARALPFPDASFDAVIMAFMLFHVPEPTDGLAQAARVASTGRAGSASARGGNRAPARG